MQIFSCWMTLWAFKNWSTFFTIFSSVHWWIEKITNTDLDLLTIKIIVGCKNVFIWSEQLSLNLVTIPEIYLEVFSCPHPVIQFSNRCSSTFILISDKRAKMCISVKMHLVVLYKINLGNTILKMNSKISHFKLRITGGRVTLNPTMHCFHRSVCKCRTDKTL